MGRKTRKGVSKTRRKQERVCSSKAFYHTAYDARIIAERMKVLYDYKKLGVYRCRICGEFHITTHVRPDGKYVIVIE